MVILDIAITYLITGLLFSIPFLFRWIGRVDEGVHGAPWTFRLIILPGCIVLWPVLLLKYLQARKKALK